MTYDIEKAKSPASPQETVLPRVFLRETGWQVTVKVGSDKTYCYQMTPGDAAYHRLLDGEFVVSRADEKLCLPCAERRGLVTFLPRTLRQEMAGVEIEPTGDDSGYDLKG